MILKLCLGHCPIAMEFCFILLHGAKGPIWDNWIRFFCSETDK